MTTYSLDDLATRVLKDLGITDGRGAPDPNDVSWATETARAVTSQLAAERVYIWNGSVEAVPEEYLVILSKRIGLDVGPSFGLFTIAEAEQAKPVVNNTLRSMNAAQPTGSTAEAEYF
jgi:hypothetical protein